MIVDQMVNNWVTIILINTKIVNYFWWINWILTNLNTVEWKSCVFHLSKILFVVYLKYYLKRSYKFCRAAQKHIKYSYSYRTLLIGRLRFKVRNAWNYLSLKILKCILHPPYWVILCIYFILKSYGMSVNVSAVLYYIIRYLLL